MQNSHFGPDIERLTRAKARQNEGNSWDYKIHMRVIRSGRKYGVYYSLARACPGNGKDTSTVENQPAPERRRRNRLTMHSPGCAGKKINCRRQAAKYRRSKKRRKRKRGKKKKRKRKRREICKKISGAAPPTPRLIKNAELPAVVRRRRKNKMAQ